MKYQDLREYVWGWYPAPIIVPVLMFLFPACQKSPEGSGLLPLVETSQISQIEATTAVSGGTVVSDGGSAVTARGVCWSVSPKPTTANDKTLDGSGIGTFTSRLAWLAPNTIYHVRAYAVNGNGTAYGNAISFKTFTAMPIVITAPVLRISAVSALAGGTVLADGGSFVDERGVCWSDHINPTKADDFNQEGSGTGTFLSSITGLHPDITYHVRAYAANMAGTAYGADSSFTTPAGSVFIDKRDSMEYGFIRIGTKDWMTQNLAYLPVLSPLTANSDTAAGYYVYGYPGSDVGSARGTSYYKTFGVLYTWPAASVACPEGWHLPRDEEWKVMELYLGMKPDEVDLENEWRTSGEVWRKLKSTTGWPDGDATNASGFSALPGGYLHYNGSFYGLGNETCFWTGSESNLTMAWCRSLKNSYHGVYRADFRKRYGFPVRCVRDSTGY